MEIPRFNNPDYADIFKHWYIYRCSHHVQACEMCMSAKEVIDHCTAWMIRTLLDKYHRRCAGSNITALKQGEMTSAEARYLCKTTPYVIPGEEELKDPLRETHDYAIAHHRLETLMTTLFPGVGLSRLGSDLPLCTGHYVPLLIGDTLFHTLHTLHSAVTTPRHLCRLPEHVTLAYMTVSMHVTPLISITPNVAWTLWAEQMPAHIILLFNSFINKK